LLFLSSSIPSQLWPPLTGNTLNINNSNGNQSHAIPVWLSLHQIHYISHVLNHSVPTLDQIDRKDHKGKNRAELDNWGN
jgi:hypothetical protein